MGKRGHGAKGKKHLGPDLGSSCSHFKVESFRGEASSERLSDSTEPEPLSSTVQGTMSGGGWEA